MTYEPISHTKTVLSVLETDAENFHGDKNRSVIAIYRLSAPDAAAACYHSSSSVTPIQWFIVIMPCLHVSLKQNCFSVAKNLQNCFSLMPHDRYCDHAPAEALLHFSSNCVNIKIKHFTGVLFLFYKWN